MSRVLLEVLAAEHIRSLVFVLIHSVWQAGLCAVLLWLALRALPARREGWRYLLSLAAMASVVVAAVLTWSVFEASRTNAVVADAGPSHLAPSPVSGGDVTTRPQEPLADVVQTPAQPRRNNISARGHSHKAPVAAENSLDWTASVAVAWMCGVLIMLLRVVGSVVRVRQLVRDAQPLTEPSLIALFEELRERLGIVRHIRVLVCDRLRVPAVLGVIWPVLLVPPAMLSGMSPEQWRVILIHELAHARRYDYLVNLIQLVIEAFFFFNPAVWWISRQVRIERESCCDALAVRLTGQPLTVARVLVDYSRRIAADRPDTGPVAAKPPRATAPVPLTATGLDGRQKSTGFFQRVRRIVVPHEHPQVRLPWYSLLGLIASVLLLIFALHRGSDTVVAVAAQYLSPQERIEKLSELQAKYGQESRDRRNGATRKVNVSGTIRTADGSPLPAKTRFHAYVRYRNVSATYSVDLDGGVFSKELPNGDIFLRVTAPEYADAYVGPLRAEQGGPIDNVFVVLDRGFTAHVRFVDEHDAAVTGVRLEQIRYVQGDRRSSIGHRHFQEKENLTSDSDGFITLQKCSDYPLQINVRAAGYQFDQKTLRLAPDTTATWELIPAAPTRGRIVSRETGQPIPDARVYLAARDGYANVGGDPRRPGKTLLTTTDDRGQFTIDSLRDGCEYVLYAKADGFGVQIVEPVTAGQKDLTVTLGPPLFVKGKILGSLDKLRRGHRHKAPFFQYRNPIKMYGGGINDLFEAEVQVRNDAGYFEITELIRGRARLELPGRIVNLDVQEPIEDLVVDLNAPPESELAPRNVPKRTVVFKFDIPSDGALPRGTLRVGYQSGDWTAPGFEDQVLPADRREIRTDAPVGSRLFYDGGKLLGYWIRNKSGIDVPDGKGPLTIAIPVVPAGAAFGRVRNPDGSDCETFRVSVITVEKPQQLKFSLMDTVYSNDGSGRFVCSPLPLNGKYRFLACDGASDSFSKVLSDVLTFDESQPIHELDLQFADGITVSGHVSGPEGHPVVGAEVSLGYSTDRHSFGDSRRPTDSRGRFRLLHVNPDVPGKYSLTIHATPTLCGAYLPEFQATEPLRPIVLKQGLHASGVLIEDSTGHVIPNATIRALPLDYRTVRYPHTLETKSDGSGRFQFQNLEPVRYRLHVDGAVEATASVNRLPDGRISYGTPKESECNILTPGKQQPHLVRLKLKPDSQLKPIPAPRY